MVIPETVMGLVVPVPVLVVEAVAPEAFAQEAV